MRIVGIRKSYGPTTVVDEVSLEIPKGSLVSFIGPNGAGKSTVMGIMARLIARDAGSVEIDGQDVLAWDSAKLARRLAILTQSNEINMRLTVRELVEFGRFPYCAGRLGPDDHQAVDQALTYMELEDLADRFLDELSGGQRQRAHIAMVIAQDTEYVLLDEPTNNLDIYHATSLMKTARRLCDELSKTVVVVLHEINYAAFYSDRVCIFHDGRIKAYGSVKEVMTPELLTETYRVDFQQMMVNDRPLSVYY